MRLLASTLFSLLLLFFAFTSCDNDNLSPPEGPSTLDFSRPAAGQKAYFQRYTSACNDVSGDFQFTGDTLQVELINDQGEFYLEEKFTEGSPLFIQGADLPVRHRISFENEYALIPERSLSTLFFFYGNDTIRLNPNAREPMTQNSCRVNYAGEVFTGDEIGNIDRFQIGPILATDKTVVACIPVILSLDAYLIYDENELVMSHTIDFSGNIAGWSLIE